MPGLPRSVRRVFLGVILFAIGQLVMDGIGVYGIRSPLLRATEVSLAVILVAGILPGSFLSRAVRWLGEQSSSISRARILLIAVGGPLLIIAVMAYFAYGDLATLRLIEDPVYQNRLLFGLGMAALQAVILALNLTELARTSPQGERG